RQKALAAFVGNLGDAASRGQVPGGSTHADRSSASRGRPRVGGGTFLGLRADLARSMSRSLIHGSPIAINTLIECKRAQSVFWSRAVPATFISSVAAIGPRPPPSPSAATPHARKRRTHVE